MRTLVLLAFLTPLAGADPLEEARHLLGGPQHAEGVAKIRAVIETLSAGEPDAAAWETIGRGHFYLEADERALAALRKAAELAPEEPEHRFWLGIVLMYSDLAKARKAMAEAVRLGPEIARYRFELGRIALFEERTDDALAAWRKACELDPAHAQAHTFAGNVLAERGEHDAARKHFEAALAAEPTALMARYNLAQLHYDAGRFDDALAHWNTAGEQAPDDYDVRKKIIQALYALDRFDDAAPHRKKLLALREQMEDKPAEFCFDQFAAGDLRVLAYERFETDGDLYYHFVFKVFDKTGKKLVRTINLESSAVTRELGFKYVLGGNEPDGTHKGFGPMWKAMPAYAALRKLVVDAADGELER